MIFSVILSKLYRHFFEFRLSLWHNPLWISCESKSAFFSAFKKWHEHFCIRLECLVTMAISPKQFFLFGFLTFIFHSLSLSLCNWTKNNLEQLKNGSTAYSSIIHSCDGFETFRIEFTIVEIFIDTQKWMNHEPKRSQSICYWFIYSKDYIMRKITLLPFFPVSLLWFELFSYLMFILFDVRIHMNW